MGIKGFARVKNWLSLDNLTSTDLNAEFNNFFTNLAAPTISGASGDPATLAGMQSMEDPGDVGSEVLPVTIQNEVREIRYQLDQIIGAAQWYSQPPTNLTALSEAIDGLIPTSVNRIVSGTSTADNQPAFLIPDGASNAITLECDPTPMFAYIDGILVEFDTDLTLSGLTQAPSSQNTALVNDPLLSGTQISETAGERNTIIQIDTIGTNFSAFNGQYCAFQTSTETFFGELVIEANDMAVSFSNASPTLVTITSSNYPRLLEYNDQIVFSGGSLPAGVSAGTVYYARPLSASTFYIHNGTSLVNTTSTGTGTGVVSKATRIQNCFRGWFFDDNSDPIDRVGLSNNDTITMLQLAWVFARDVFGTQSLSVTYNRPYVAAIQPTGVSIGDLWLDLTADQWKIYNGSSFDSYNAIFVGMAATNTTNTIAARSFDFNKAFNTLNSFEIDYLDTDNVRANNLSPVVSVYGSVYQFSYGQPNWSIVDNLEPGVSLNAFDTCWAYISDLGEVYVSNIAPHLRKFDLLGDYHPSKPWRAVGSFSVDATATVIDDALPIDSSLFNQHVLPYDFVQNANILPATIDGTRLVTNINCPGTNVTSNYKPVIVHNLAGALPVAYIGGVVASDGSIAAGQGYTVSHPGTGEYVITWTQALAGEPAVTVALVDSSAATDVAPRINVHAITGGTSIEIRTYNNSASVADRGFSFMAIGQRAL